MWDEDRRRSGGEIVRKKRGQMFVEELEVRDALGRMIGTLIIEHLLPEKPTPIWDRQFRASLSDIDEARIRP